MKVPFPHAVIVLLAVLLFAGGADARAVGCGEISQAASSVTVRLLDPAPQLVTSKNLKQINSKAKLHGLLKRGSMVLGLTQSEVETTMNMRFRGFEQGRLACVIVDRIDVTFGHSIHNIQMPREYTRGTCQYKAVLKHEKEHVRVNRAGVRKYAAVLKRELERAQHKMNPMQVSTMRQGQAKAKSVMQKVVKSVTARFNKEINAQHAKIDQPGGPYDATGACRNW